MTVKVQLINEVGRGVVNHTSPKNRSKNHLLVTYLNDTTQFNYSGIYSHVPAFLPRCRNFRDIELKFSIFHNFHSAN